MIQLIETLAENIPLGTQIKIGSKSSATPIWYTVLGKNILGDISVRKETDNTVMEIHPKTAVLYQIENY